MNRRKLLLGAATAALLITSPSLGAYLPLTTSMANALDYNIKGDGSTNDGAAINAFYITANALNATAYFPGNTTYECGSTSLSIPANTKILCGSGAVFRRSSYGAAIFVNTPTAAFLNVGSNCVLTGGNYTNTAISGTSVTSNTIGLGSKTFTVPSGLPGLTVAPLLRFYSTSSPQNYIEGAVTSYTGTSVTINAIFSSGSGTFTSWTFIIGAVYQAAIVMRNCTGVLLDGVQISGLHYSGFLLDGNGSGILNSNCTLRDCTATQILNRAYDFYGNVTNSICIGCRAIGNNNTDYGFNFNAANTGGSQQILDCMLVDCYTKQTLFQGFALGDKTFRCTWTGCIADGVSNSAGVGFELVFANSGAPQFNNISNCIAQSCVGQGFSVFGGNYNAFSNISAFSCGIGIDVGSSGGNNSSENVFMGFICTGCTTGVLLQAGSINSVLYGKATGNTTNYTNSGSGTGGAVFTT